MANARARSTAAALLVATLAATSPGPAHAARAERLEMRRLEIELGGPPVAVLPADLDGDGRFDLVIATAYTYWGQTSTHRTEEMDGKLWEMVEVLPTLNDRREIQLYLAREDGSYEAAAPAQPLPVSVLAFDLGPAAHPVLALTDTGLSEVRFDPAADEVLTFVPLLEEPPVMAGTQTLLPGYNFTKDVDGDGILDVLLPANDGLAIYLGGDGGLRDSGARLLLPGDASGKDGVAWRRTPLLRVQDVDGDQVADLVLFHRSESAWRLVQFDGSFDLGAISVLRGVGGGGFEEARGVHTRRLLEPESLSLEDAVDVLLSNAELSGTLAHFDDLDGDGRAELVTYKELPPEKDGFLAEMKDAKRPRHTYHLYHVGPDLVVEDRPYRTFTAQGYPFIFDWLDEPTDGFVDLDGDGLKDLITVDLDFSLWQLPKILLAKSLGVGLDFHVWSQRQDGSFREVEDSRLRGKVKVNLKRAALVEFAQFGGDFDGTGRTDFVSMGGGRKVTIHRGQERCVYPRKADVTITLKRTPDDAGLVKVLDLDGDRRSDLMVFTLLNPDEEGETRPTRVEFYLTGSGI